MKKEDLLVLIFISVIWLGILISEQNITGSATEVSKEESSISDNLEEIDV